MGGLLLLVEAEDLEAFQHPQHPILPLGPLPLLFDESSPVDTLPVFKCQSALAPLMGDVD